MQSLYTLLQVIKLKVEGFKEAEGKEVAMYIPNKPPIPVPLDKTLVESGAIGAATNKVHLVAVFKDVALLPSAIIDAPPEEANPELLRYTFPYLVKSLSGYPSLLSCQVLSDRADALDRNNFSFLRSHLLCICYS